MRETKTHKDISGIRFGRLTAVSKERDDPKGDYWLCQCDCGNTKVIRCDALMTGRTKSCGCLTREVQRKRKTVHGLYNSRLYRIFYAIHQRCDNKNDSKYQYYGGRGISVCDEWSGKNGFISFYEWSMQNGYKENLTIDRIDNSKGYAPCNCRWATRSEQSENMRRTIRIYVDGKSITLREASKKYGVNRETIYNRIKSGWSEEIAAKTPTQTKYSNKRSL